MTATATAEAPAPERRKKKLRLPGFMLALPAWFWLLFFFVIPVAFIVYYSFGYKPSLLTLKAGQSNAIATDHLGFTAYRNVLTGIQGDAVVATFRNTLSIALIGTLICLIVGFPFAYWLAVKVPEKWRGVLLGLILVPFWTNFLIRTIGWQILLTPDGWLSSGLQHIGLMNHKLNILDTREAVQLGVVYNYLVLMILPLFVALDRLDPALREASKDLGANRFKTWLQVTLPLSMPGVISGMLLVFIPLMGDYITASVLGGAKGTMVGRLVYDKFLTAQNWADGSAMAMVLMGLILITVVIFGLLIFVVTKIAERRRRVHLTPVGATA
jgi:spermidine/putrescine transport system permease protein